MPYPFLKRTELLSAFGTKHSSHARSERIAAIIPARGGSKGIKNKNIIPICGKPLIAFSIEAALYSKYIAETVVSSDDEKILNISLELGATALKRPPELATDAAPSEPVISHVLSQLKSEGREFDIVMLLQPTSPLRISEDIDGAVEAFYSRHTEALISVYSPAHAPLKAFMVNENGFLQGVFNNEAPFMRRQDLPDSYYPNGAIFMTYVRLFMASGSFLASKTIPYIMPEERSIDIDTIQDVRAAEKYFRKKHKLPGNSRLRKK
jgi:CMP-N-acetylneuraminic acid synthetase